MSKRSKSDYLPLDIDEWWTSKTVLRMSAGREFGQVQIFLWTLCVQWRKRRLDADPELLRVALPRWCTDEDWNRFRSEYFDEAFPVCEDDPTTRANPVLMEKQARIDGKQGEEAEKRAADAQRKREARARRTSGADVQGSSDATSSTASAGRPNGRKADVRAQGKGREEKVLPLKSPEGDLGSKASPGGSEPDPSPDAPLPSTNRAALAGPGREPPPLAADTSDEPDPPPATSKELNLAASFRATWLTRFRAVSGREYGWLEHDDRGTRPGRDAKALRSLVTQALGSATPLADMERAAENYFASEYHAERGFLLSTLAKSYPEFLSARSMGAPAPAPPIRREPSRAEREARAEWEIAESRRLASLTPKGAAGAA